MIESWCLFPSEAQRPLKDAAAAVKRLRGKCQVLALDDGSILLTGQAQVLTKAFRAQTLPYVTEIWLELRKGKR